MQAGFFDFVALPLLRTWVAICPQAHTALELTEANRQRWIDFAAQPSSSSFAARRSSGSSSTLPSPASQKPSLGKWSSTAANTFVAPPAAATDIKAHTLPIDEASTDTTDASDAGDIDEGALADDDR